MAKARSADILPFSLPPLGVNREQAAELIGVSASTFDKLVAAGRMPRPREVSLGRLVYDVAELAAAFRRIPHQAGPGDAGDRDMASIQGNPWDE